MVLLTKPGAKTSTSHPRLQRPQLCLGLAMGKRALHTTSIIFHLSVWKSMGLDWRFGLRHDKLPNPSQQGYQNYWQQEYQNTDIGSFTSGRHWQIARPMLPTKGWLTSGKNRTYARLSIK